MMSSPRKKAHLADASGFTIIELIVSMTIFTIVTGAIFGVMQIARQTRSVVTENTSLNKNVRLALNLVGRDAYNAGYGYPLLSTVVLPDNRVYTLLNLVPDTDTSRDTIPPIIAGDNVNPNTFNPIPNSKTDQVTFLYKDSSFNLVGGVSQPLKINAATTSGTGIDEIVPISGSNAGCSVNDLYLVTGNTGSTLGVVTALSGSDKVQFANGDVLNFNLTGTSGPLRSITLPAAMQKVFMTTYWVTTDGTLMRREYANKPPTVPASGFVDEPLVYGVEDFQIEYIMDDGTVNTNPIAGPDGVAGTPDDTPGNLGAIRQIRFTIRVRSVENMPNGQPYRTAMTATFSTRNLGYDAN